MAVVDVIARWANEADSRRFEHDRQDKWNHLARIRLSANLSRLFACDSQIK